MILGAVVLLIISSTVTMAIPFSLGKVLDIIYTSSEDAQTARTRLNHVCSTLLCVFILGAFCNFGRVYLMSTIGEWI